MERIILPAVAAMEPDGRSFKGVLCADLILLEFNVRFGDLEAQVLIMRLMSGLLPALIAARERVLKSVDLRWHPEHAVCVVMAARGYSGEPGTEISDLTAASEGCLVFLW
jgi:phosphoribosylamine---glycine ligase